MTKDNKIKKCKSKKKQGRPSKLTPELQAEIILLIRVGNFVETVCTTVGINKSTFYNWIKKGEQSNHPRNKYNIFQKSVKKAMAWSEAKDVANITKHSENDWRASAWKLSRKFPKKWGKKSYEDLDLDIEDLGKVDLKDIPKEDYIVIKEVLNILATQRDQK